MEALHHQAATDGRGFDDQAVDIQVMVVFRVGDRRLQRFRYGLGDALRAELEIEQRLVHVLAADHLRDKVQLARAGAYVAQAGHRLALCGTRFVCRFTHLSIPSYFAAAGAAFLSAAVWPWNWRVGANSPNL